MIEKNENRKVELTKEEIQRMLDDAYCQGYSDGKRSSDAITHPSYPWTITYSDQNDIPMDKVTIKGNV